MYKSFALLVTLVCAVSAAPQLGNINVGLPDGYGLNGYGINGFNGNGFGIGPGCSIRGFGSPLGFGVGNGYYNPAFGSGYNRLGLNGYGTNGFDGNVFTPGYATTALPL